MERLAEKYADDLEIFNLYVREPHANEGIFGKYDAHASYEQKMGYAKELVEQKGIKKVTVLVDGMDQKAHEAFGWLPNMVYLADREGSIVYKATWTKPEVLEGVIREILAEEKQEVGEKKADAVPA
jgi:hypothetical protein